IFKYRDNANYIVGNINEKSFYQVLMKNIYVALTSSKLNSSGQSWRDSQEFKNVMYKLHNDFLPIIRAGMIDSNGDITKYSLNNEIVQLEIDLNYVFV